MERCGWAGEEPCVAACIATVLIVCCCCRLFVLFCFVTSQPQRSAIWQVFVYIKHPCIIGVFSISALSFTNEDDGMDQDPVWRGVALQWGFWASLVLFVFELYMLSWRGALIMIIIIKIKNKVLSSYLLLTLSIKTGIYLHIYFKPSLHIRSKCNHLLLFVTNGGGGAWVACLQTTGDVRFGNVLCRICVSWCCSRFLLGLQGAARIVIGLRGDAREWSWILTFFLKQWISCTVV